MENFAKYIITYNDYNSDRNERVLFKNGWEDCFTGMSEEDKVKEINSIVFCFYNDAALPFLREHYEAFVFYYRTHQKDLLAIVKNIFEVKQPKVSFNEFFLMLIEDVATKLGGNSLWWCVRECCYDC